MRTEAILFLSLFTLFGCESRPNLPKIPLPEKITRIEHTFRGKTDSVLDVTDQERLLKCLRSAVPIRNKIYSGFIAESLRIENGADGIDVVVVRVGPSSEIYAHDVQYESQELYDLLEKMWP